ncbi:Heat shock protein GrpE [Corynebacterium camporealensis]|uniref:Protein GrpE n=1 Tax=Corynebacterium camporealensis TaxID=161896 RepID=A0A0F6QZS7_9CORY|nr:nucleotide exchange factor GrpE [Corynebacterium camporealensis]AKE40023.1 molecular chaperone GrpE (heat shock protein) [Corynebacterium camporealensis]AVH89109.1 Heat shock protein GrpE [Corynebacterium camporealensis]
MSQNQDMPDNPGDPAQTDPEATSADAAEEAAEAAEARQDAQADAAEEAELDPTLDADLDAALADVDPETAAEPGDPDPEAAGGVEDIEAQLAERTEDLQRLNAEYTNYRRRTERERQAVIQTAKAQVLSKFLPILDDLELARQHGDLDEGPLKSFGDKLRNAMEAEQLEGFGDEGDTFDPEIHEAVQDLSSGDEKVVGTVLRRGYRVGDKLVRNAMVIIADPSEEQAD